MSLPCMINEALRTITVVWSTGPETYNMDTVKGKIVVEGVRDNKTEFNILADLESVTNLSKYIKDYPRLSIVGNKVYLDSIELPKALSTRLISFMENGLPVNYLINFADNVMKNPSYAATQELYDFLEHQDLVITEDGHFLAYKSVRDDYRDWHTGTCDNSPGNVLEMPRNNVSDDRRKSCDAGYHAGAWSYSSSFGGSNKRIVIVKISPENVVSVPLDYDCTKLRTCKYEVLRDITQIMNDSPLYSSNGEPFACEGYGSDFDWCDDLDYDNEDGKIYDCNDCSDCDCGDDKNWPEPPTIYL